MQSIMAVRTRWYSGLSGQHPVPGELRSWFHCYPIQCLRTGRGRTHPGSQERALDPAWQTRVICTKVTGWEVGTGPDPANQSPPGEALSLRLRERLKGMGRLGPKPAPFSGHRQLDVSQTGQATPKRKRLYSVTSFMGLKLV